MHCQVRYFVLFLSLGIFFCSCMSREEIVVIEEKPEPELEVLEDAAISNSQIVLSLPTAINKYSLDTDGNIVFTHLNTKGTTSKGADIWVYSNKALLKLTSRSFMHEEVSFSFDNKDIYFVLGRNKQTPENWLPSIWSMSSDGFSQTQKAGPRMYDIKNPIESPDGTLLAFSGKEKENAPFFVYIWDKENEEIKKITKGRYPTWMPDSKRIVFEEVYGPTGKSSIWICGVDGRRLSLISSDTNRHLIQPDVSLDGTKIVVCKSYPEKNEKDLYIINLRTNKNKQITNGAGVDMPIWLGEKYLYFRNQNKDACKILRLPVENL